jgi:G:T/U-mismatch repair DNA glycosylase
MHSVNLKEILHARMDILFVALNPPDTSNRNGHYFSYNLSFWNLLRESGLITKKVKSKLTGDDEVFRDNKINFNQSIFGITDLVHDLVETKSSKVKTDVQRVHRILQVVNTRQVKLLCLMHSRVATAFQEAGLVKRGSYGLVGKHRSTSIYEVPFHNASIYSKAKFYELLKESL